MKTTTSTHRKGQVPLALKRILLLMLLPVLSLQGCAGFQPQETGLDRKTTSREVRFFRELDAAVTAAGVQEASSFPVGGFPYLRTNRFLAHLEDRTAGGNEFDAWVEEMNRLGIQAQRKEIDNLPQASLQNLAGKFGGRPDRAALVKEMLESAERLKTSDRNQPGFDNMVRRGVYVPDEYSTPMRIFGLYAVAAIPVVTVANNANKKFRRYHRTPLEDLPLEGELVVWGPASGSGLTEAGLMQMFSPSRRNALGLPELDKREVLALVHAYAPVIAQDTLADYDRFGEVEWQKNRVSVNPLRPAVYHYLTYSFVNQRPVLQLNYALWYSERNGKKSPAIERGPLDGLTLRVSLDPAGRPLMVDVMNNCGCYHFYAPRKGKVELKKPNSRSLYPFVTTWLPESYPSLPLTIRVNSGWHQVEHLYAEAPPDGFETYRLLPYDLLEALPHADGQTESVFDRNGIMKNSRRIEPYLLFSMGIPRIGYMRQRGHHAIHIVGRAHFTDPDIFDRYFIFR